jgi:hypothetical protein
MIVTAITSGSPFNGSKPFFFGQKAQKSPRRHAIKLRRIRRAAARIAPFIKRTPCVRDGVLSERFDSNFYLKLELLQNTGAFKVRGAFNKLLTLSDEEKERGIVAVSGGNHAQAVAFAAQTLGHRALILMPEITPRNYIEKTLSYGARVEFSRRWRMPSAVPGDTSAKVLHTFTRLTMRPSLPGKARSVWKLSRTARR